MVPVKQRVKTKFQINKRGELIRSRKFGRSSETRTQPSASRLIMITING
jgi:hypothetical protein